MPDDQIADRTGRGRRVEEPVGGEPVCLMHRLCPACGGLANEDPPTTCPHCGSEIEE
jgi:rubrerythrin